MLFEDFKKTKTDELKVLSKSLRLPENYVDADIFKNVKNKEELNKLFNHHKMLLEVMQEMPNTNNAQLKSEMQKFNEQQRKRQITKKEPKSYLLGSNQLPNSKSPGHQFYPKAGTYPPPRDFVKPPSVDYSQPQSQEYHGDTLPKNSSQSMKTSASTPQLRIPNINPASNFYHKTERAKPKLVVAKRDAKKKPSISDAEQIFLNFTNNYKYEHNEDKKTIECNLKKGIDDETKIQTTNKKLLKGVIKLKDKKHLAKNLIEKIFKEIITHKTPFKNQAEICHYFREKKIPDRLEHCIGLFFYKAFGFDREQRSKEIKKFRGNVAFEKMFLLPGICNKDGWMEGGKKITKKNRKINNPIKTRKNKKTNQSKKINKKPIKKLTKKKSKSSRV